LRQENQETAWLHCPETRRIEFTLRESDQLKFILFSLTTYMSQEIVFNLPFFVLRFRNINQSFIFIKNVLRWFKLCQVLQCYRFCEVDCFEPTYSSRSHCQHPAVWRFSGMRKIRDADSIAIQPLCGVNLWCY
jgi:uncharacterized membrane-anchored protein YitT (DUF2179 family)